MRRGRSGRSPAFRDVRARLPRLADLHQNASAGRGGGEHVADTNGVLGHPLDGDVFAEGAEGQVDPEQAPPSRVVFGRIAADRLVRAAVMLPVGLKVAVQVFGAEPDAAVGRRL
jgi:hypothetical protein